MFKRIVSVLALALVLFSAFSFTSPVLADSGGKKVEGTIAAVDTTANTVTITPKKGGADVTVNVDATTRIKHNGKLAAIADLQVGDKAEAKYSLATMLASKIESESPKPPKPSKVKGVIAAVDTTANTVTITPSKGGADVTLNVDASTLIKKNKTTISLADLKAGDLVEARYNSSTMLASKIEVKLPEFKGTISALDTAAGTITVTPFNGGAAMTFSVDASTIIKKNHQIVGLDALVIGDRVEVKYDSATMLAFTVEVDH
jgi:hypothetical protein